MSSTCAVCGVECKLSCSSCHNEHYCSREHQMSHWKHHKGNCHALLLESLENAPVPGKYWIATNDIKQGALIFKEKSTMFGPTASEFSHPVCLGCCGLILSEGEVRCTKCNWNVCDAICEKKSGHAENECKTFAENKIHPPPNLKFEDWYFKICVLRCLLLKESSPEEWKKIKLLSENGQFDNLYPFYKTYSDHSKIVEFIQNTCKMTQFDDETIIFASALVKLKSLADDNALNRELVLPIVGISEKTRCSAALWQMGSLLKHDCVPNTKIIVTESKSGSSLTLEAKAAVDIKAGTPITLTHVNVFQGTLERQLFLTRRKQFNCTCTRCSDKTELGTGMGSIKCQDCVNGFMYPQCPPICVSVWSCSSGNPNCSLITASRVFEVEKGIKDEISSLLQSSDGEYSVKILKKMELILIRHSGQTVHPNHYILFRLKLNMICRIYMVSRKEKPNSTLVSRGEDLSGECLNILDVVKPGWNRERGLLLFYMGYMLTCKDVDQKTLKKLKTASNRGPFFQQYFTGLIRETRDCLSSSPPGTYEFKIYEEMVALLPGLEAGPKGPILREFKAEVKARRKNKKTPKQQPK